MHELTEQLQNDRRAEVFFQDSHAEQEAHLRDTVRAANWQQPPLPRSPCIKVKRTGQIWPWSASFAARPDLCEACDEQGNPWQGEAAPPPPPPPKLNVDISRKPVGDEHTSHVGMASEILGVAENFSKDFTSQLNVKEALPLPEQETSVAVDALVQAVFKNQKG